MKSDTEKALNQLVGLPLWGAGSAGSMQWFEFGECREITKPDESSYLVGEWALHVFCAWRIRNSTQILAASYDRRRKIDRLTDYVENFGRDEDFDKHLAGENQASLKTKAFLSDKTYSLRVAKVAMEGAGGFQLILDSGFSLDVFPDCSIAGFEHWRIFKPFTNSSHFVMSIPN